jgi:hypothetical protein
VARRRRCGLAIAARVWTKFVRDRALFLGVLDPTRRGDGVLRLLSSNRTQIRLCLENIVKGAILGLVTIRERTPGRVELSLIRVGNRVTGRVIAQVSRVMPGQGKTLNLG